MIFRVCEHYDNIDQNSDNSDKNSDNSDKNSVNSDKNKYENNEDNIIEGKECFICFEDECINSFIIDLKEQTLYIKNCLCNGYIHVDCLNRWIDLYNSCPVCRKTVLKVDQTIFILYRYSPFCINIYLGFKTIGIKLIKFLTFIILFYFILDYFFTIVLLRSNLYEDLLFKHSLKI
jgi:hypothetical protein